MDAYGTIEPVNLEAMEDTFKRLCADPSVQVQGTHWGSLINAYGRVQKDLTKTIEVFDSIASHPSTLKSRALLPDAVAYEALINVFVTLRRMDLIAGYMQQFEDSGVHMTAYIANLLIKGYAVSGNLDKARQIFESLDDPQQGVAAPNNHAPHETSAAAKIDRYAPVYREVSSLILYSPLSYVYSSTICSHLLGRLWFVQNLAMEIVIMLWHFWNECKQGAVLF
jgi:pentatricopeptide repeat protein